MERREGNIKEDESKVIFQIKGSRRERVRVGMKRKSEREEWNEGAEEK